MELIIAIVVVIGFYLVISNQNSGLKRMAKIEKTLEEMNKKLG